MSDMVATFGTTAHRRQLLVNLIRYRAMLNAEGFVSGIQFIDGSFVEDVERIAKRDPRDIDVFSLLCAPAKYHQDQALWQSHGIPFWQNEVINRDHNKMRFNLDTHGVLFEEVGRDPIRLMTATIYWYSLFSHQRETYQWKGFAALALDPAADQAALAELGST